jgi:dynein heavy chain, axonemal
LKESILENNLQPAPTFLNKNIELYEMLCVRHGIMVVGPTGGGKSSNIRMLGTALTKLKQKEVEGDKFEVVKIHHLNPKSVRMGELYGEFDSNTVRYRIGQ